MCQIWQKIPTSTPEKQSNSAWMKVIQSLLKVYELTVFDHSSSASDKASPEARDFLLRTFNGEQLWKSKKHAIEVLDLKEKFGKCITELESIIVFPNCVGWYE